MRPALRRAIATIVLGTAAGMIAGLGVTRTVAAAPDELNALRPSVLAPASKTITTAPLSAVAPGGTITTAPLSAVAPGGTITTATLSAVAPGGTITTAALSASAPGGTITTSPLSARAPSRPTFNAPVISVTAAPILPR